MTRDEVVGLLAHMAVAWPSMEVHPAATELWVRHCEDLDVEPARVAFDRLVESDEWPPTIARFREAVAVATPRSDLIGLPLPRMPLDEVRPRLAEVRAELERGRRGDDS